MLCSIFSRAMLIFTNMRAIQERLNAKGYQPSPMLFGWPILIHQNKFDLNMNLPTIAQSGKMYPHDCEAVAGVAILLLKSALNKHYKQDKIENLIKVDNLTHSERFGWDYCSIELFEEFDLLYDKVLQQIHER